MKKLIAIFLVLVSLNAKSQDTTYHLRGKDLYMRTVTNTIVNDTSSWTSYKKKQEISRRRNKRQNILAFGVFISTIILVWKP
jgi:hypothetical protein